MKVHKLIWLFASLIVNLQLKSISQNAANDRPRASREDSEDLGTARGARKGSCQSIGWRSAESPPFTRRGLFLAVLDHSGKTGSICAPGFKGTEKTEFGTRHGMAESRQNLQDEIRGSLGAVELHAPADHLHPALYRTATDRADGIAPRPRHIPCSWSTLRHITPPLPSFPPAPPQQQQQQQPAFYPAAPAYALPPAQMPLPMSIPMSQSAPQPIRTQSYSFRAPLAPQPRPVRASTYLYPAPAPGQKGYVYHPAPGYRAPGSGAGAVRGPTKEVPLLKRMFGFGGGGRRGEECESGYKGYEWEREQGEVPNPFIIAPHIYTLHPPCDTVIRDTTSTSPPATPHSPHPRSTSPLRILTLYIDTV
ncbi:hypothetical protein B0H13DRAFT_2310258 [Mycena leptocephala]|nr:hypothetical protein B0H13DRAFT_2310258 [Mycena leptocephala]